MNDEPEHNVVCNSLETEKLADNIRNLSLEENSRENVNEGNKKDIVSNDFKESLIIDAEKTPTKESLNSKLLYYFYNLLFIIS